MVRLTLCDEHHILVGCGRSTDPMLKDIPGRGLYGKARRAFCSAISVMVVTEVQSSIPLSPDRCTDHAPGQSSVEDRRLIRAKPMGNCCSGPGLTLQRNVGLCSEHLGIAVLQLFGCVQPQEGTTSGEPCAVSP
jgi:hypothetical protein